MEQVGYSDPVAYFASEEVAVWAVVVEPIDQQAASFYQRFGFEPLLDSVTMF